MDHRKDKRYVVHDVYIRLTGIVVIGVVMPLIFYTKSDTGGLLKWILISTLLTLVAWETSRYVVSFLWRRYPWEKNPFLHLLVISFFLLVLIFVLGLIVYYINYFFHDVDGNYWVEMKSLHLSILLITFFTTSVYEGYFLFYKWKETLILSASLEKENIKSQYETLKNQVNPHFLFNNLNALSSLIPENPQKAVEFVNEFSSVYRYVLDIKDLNSVELEDELSFVKSYIYLQKIRFGENLAAEINIDQEKLHLTVMPLSLQVLIENAIKHNEISDMFPLKINVWIEEDFVVVKNNINRKNYSYDSPNTGLKNLTDRYRLVSERLPYFRQDEKEFIAAIPLLTEN
ncbi:MAG: histidine kinase [Bacteroidota bacterium]